MSNTNNWQYHNDPAYRAKVLERARQTRLQRLAADPVKIRAQQAKQRRDRVARLKAQGLTRKQIDGKNKRKSGGANSKDCKTRLCAGARLRDRKAGRPGTLKKEDLYWPTHCPVLGIELIYGEERRKDTANPANATLDRWDNSLGYEPGNVYVISWRANSLKSNGTADELQAVADYARDGTWKAS